MGRIAACLVAMVLVACSPAVAQDSTTSQTAPRFHVGAGGGVLADNGVLSYQTLVLEARAGVRLTRAWSVEGLFDFSRSRQFYGGVYRIQAVRRIGHDPYQPFVTIGGAANFFYRRPEYRWTDADGHLNVIPAETSLHIDPPVYPTVGVGFEKIVTSHLAVRAELAVAFGVNDDGLAAAWLPAVSVSIPLGRYRTGR